MLPKFYSLSGEEAAIPKRFLEAVRAVTKAVIASAALIATLPEHHRREMKDAQTLSHPPPKFMRKTHR